MTTPAQSRVVSVLYGALSLVLLVVVAAVALVVRPAAPPAVAEFAPRDPQRIEDARADQSSRFGSGADGACHGEGCDPSRASATGDRRQASTTTTTVIDRNRVRRCVGQPARQTEDPQSPPCVNYFDGDNGGATARGVTRDEIRVAIRASGPIATMLETFFNRRYEFHGRSIRLVSLDVSEPIEEAPAWLALAQKVEDLDVFAALAFDSQVTDTRPFIEDVARRGIVTIDRQSRLTAAQIRSRSPYLWQYSPALDDVQAETVAVACRSLVGEPARYGGPDVVAKNRKFAVLYAEDDGPDFHTSTLVDGLRGCGAPVDVLMVGRDADTEDEYRAQLATLQAFYGTTTVICVCDENDQVLAMRGAQNTSFFPEWLLSGLIAGENPNVYLNQVPAEQRAHVFGVASDNKYLAPVDEPWYWAVKEANPEFTSPNLNRYSGSVYEMYQQLLLLASGIQTAGPRLTPETFRAGLEKTVFPNPGAGRAPMWQATVGFDRGDRTMVQDVALVYWNETANASAGGGGGFCYVQRGNRYRKDTWPPHPVVFFSPTEPCR